MSKVTSIAELSPARCRTIVINVHTDLIATRAVLSALRLSDTPVCVVNCEPTDDSRAHFGRLVDRYDIDVVESRVINHGELLDRIFGAAPDQALLLLDSDAELRKPGFADGLIAQLDHPRCFGAGYLWGPFLIDEAWLAPPGAEILYLERPWIPCVAFDVALVRKALDAGASFNARVTANEVQGLPRLSNFLGARWGGPWAAQSPKFARLPRAVREQLSTVRLDGLRGLRIPFHGYRPHLVVRDTGGEIYEYLRFRRGLAFAGGPVDLIDGQVHHYLGVTRHVLYGSHAMDTAPDEVADEVIARLRTVYGFEWPTG